nr:hypothetical protein [Escherichia coli]
MAQKEKYHKTGYQNHRNETICEGNLDGKETTAGLPESMTKPLAFRTDLKKSSIFVGLTSALNTVTFPLISGLTITGLPVFEEYH